MHEYPQIPRPPVRRQADAVVALSPGTDSTAQSPSWAANVETDQMLGPMFGFIAKLPQTVALWWQFISNRVRPCNPVISPIHGDLSGLPPTLVHASEAEMLLDDSRRYVNKAQAAGSPVTLQTWPHVMHVWHGLALTVPAMARMLRPRARSRTIRARC